MKTTWIERFVSDYGKENGFIDYKALADAIKWDTGGMVLANEIGTQLMYDSDTETVCGNMHIYYDEDYNEITEDEYHNTDKGWDYEMVDFFQYFIISGGAVEILEAFNETVFYNPNLDVYIWAVTHFGTSWDYVLTDTPITGQ